MDKVIQSCLRFPFQVWLTMHYLISFSSLYCMLKIFYSYASLLFWSGCSSVLNMTTLMLLTCLGSALCHINIMPVTTMRSTLSTFIHTVYFLILGAHWRDFFSLVSLQSSSDDCDPHEGIHEGKEGEYRLQVTQFVQRLEYWHKELTNTLVTSITVVPVHSRAVAYLGTADGRHIQVNKSRCSVLLQLMFLKDWQGPNLHGNY